MSANLTLKIKLFGQYITPVNLYLTSTDETRDCIGDNAGNEKYCQRYTDLCQNFVSEYNIDCTEIEDHIRKVKLYGSHLHANWLG